MSLRNRLAAAGRALLGWESPSRSAIVEGFREGVADKPPADPETDRRCCPCCGEEIAAGHADGRCRLAAILASSKPGERALSELLAEELEAGRAEGITTKLRTAAQQIELEEACAKGAAEEREACSKIADEAADLWDGRVLVSQQIAAAIRARATVR